MHTFGDKNTFAIQYRFDNKEDKSFPYCHFIFNDKLIGNEDENCYLPSWIFALSNLKKKILANEGFLSEPIFSTLSEEEIFQFLVKNNQNEVETNENIWQKYFLQLDETIDDYIIFILEENQQLKFLWKNYQKEDEKLQVMYTSHEHFYKTIDDCLTYLKY